jgi:hypothetical protein
MICSWEPNDAFTYGMIVLMGWPIQEGAPPTVDIPDNWVEAILGEGWAQAPAPPGQRIFHASQNSNPDSPGIVFAITLVMQGMA